MMGDEVGVGLIGWGLAGRYFHAPFVQVTPGLALRGVVTRREVARTLFPEAQAVASVEALLADPAIALVIVASPNRLHVPQARAALAAGKHVVVEKPVAETAAAWQELIAAAQAADRLLIPFQNRRWDGDFRTVQQLIAAGLLGEVLTYESRWPKYRPQLTMRAGWKEAEGRTGGVLYDLGPHLVDQAICLFGRPARVYAQVATQRLDAATDDLMRLSIQFENGVQALLEVDLLNPFPGPRFNVRGRYGAYEIHGLDPQEARLRAGE
ncbi:MAG: Gfo/Idh/MocA family oxidoreductase, partial [Anaerolineales bacterium]|nr:Gfo/Idh/MocA family oxidoreductase [Anaerolineales bacterium]